MSWCRTSSGAPRPAVRSLTEEPATRTSSVVHASEVAVGLMVGTLSNRSRSRKRRGAAAVAAGARSAGMEGGRRLRVAQPALAVVHRERRALAPDHAHVAHEARVRAEPLMQHAGQ